MVVGAARVVLHVHGSQSLKEKRGVVRSIVQRVRNRFNVSIAEVGGQDTWQRAELLVAVASHARGPARATLERVVEFIEGLHLAEVVAQELEIL
jgi:uncharacterized protein